MPVWRRLTTARSPDRQSGANSRCRMTPGGPAGQPPARPCAGLPCPGPAGPCPGPGPARPVPCPARFAPFCPVFPGRIRAASIGATPATNSASSALKNSPEPSRWTCSHAQHVRSATSQALRWSPTPAGPNVSRQARSRAETRRYRTGPPPAGPVPNARAMTTSTTGLSSLSRHLRGRLIMPGDRGWDRPGSRGTSGTSGRPPSWNPRAPATWPPRCRSPPATGCRSARSAADTAPAPTSQTPFCCASARCARPPWTRPVTSCGSGRAYAAATWHPQWPRTAWPPRLAPGLPRESLHPPHQPRVAARKLIFFFTLDVHVTARGEDLAVDPVAE